MWMKNIVLLLAITSIWASPIYFKSEIETKDGPQSRLTTEFWPEHYEITLTPYLEAEPENDKDEWTFDGSAKIKFKTSLPGLKTVTLNSNQLDISEVKLYKDSDPENILVSTYGEEPSSHLLIINSENDFIEDESYIVEASYKGYLNDEMTGFYRSTYYENGVEKRMAATQFQSIGARRSFPCFDEPRFKATFQLKIIHLNNYHAISNTKIEAENIKENDRIETVFGVTPKMSSYLVAFIVSEYVDRSNDDGTFAVWARTEMYDQTEYAFEVGPKILQYLDDYTEYPYYTTIDKMDMAAIPDFAAGAMENWGLITYRETALLFDETRSTVANKQRIAAVIAHEQAHMWFGDLVTCDTWDEVWLNEGFATYHEYFSTAKVETDWDYDLQFVVSSMQLAYSVDASNSTHPMTHPTGSQYIIYNKAGSVIRMLEHMMGKDEFLAGIREYLSVNAFATAVPSKLYAALQNHVDELLDIADIMESWVDQEGFPVLQVIFNEARTEASLSQKRFLSQDPGHSDTLIYKIPITYANKNGNGFEDTSYKMILTSETETLEVASQDSWTIFNVQEVGFYRVNYDEASWMLIRDGLLAENFDGIHVLNRAQIVDDVLNLARSELLTYETAFDILDYLANEQNYIPWVPAFNGLSYISRRLVGSESNNFSKYIISMLTKVYNHLGFYEKTTDTHTDKLNRANVLQWACKFGLQDCIDNALMEFQMAKDDETHVVPVGIRQVVYCIGIREGIESDWDWMWNKFENEQLATEQILLINALGCTTDSNVLTKYLDNIMTDKVRKQDKSAAFTSTYSSHDKNIDHIWSYIEANHDKIFNSVGSYSGVASLISGLATRFTTREQVDALSSFIESNSDLLGSSASTLASAVNAANYELFWASNNLDTIENILNKKTQLSYRLTRDVLPSKYVVTLTTYLEAEEGHEEWTFDGEVEITVKAQVSDVDTITLHYSDIEVIDVSVSEEGLTDNLVGSTPYESETHKWNLYLNTVLDTEKNYIIKATYKGYMRDDMHGFYKTTYTEDGETIRMGSTQFQTTFARRAFPCFDEPSFKAIFQMNIVHLNKYNAISNTAASATAPSGTERTITSFNETPVMSTYLIAFIVSQYTSRKEGDFGVWARPEMYDQTEYALQVGVDLLNYFNEYTNFPYYSTIPKMDMAAIPDFSAGAMENWGLLTYRETNLLYHPDMTTPLTKQRIAAVIAHEQAHMWFGDLVTCDWWGYTWLNEGFARYHQYFTTAKIETGMDVDLQFVVEQLQGVFQMDALESSHPMNHDVNSPSEVSGIFDNISYNKGATIIRMIEHLMGKDKFLTAIQRYLQQNQYSTSLPEKLYSALQTEATVDIADIMGSWADQVGYPVLSVEINEERTKADISQKRFLSQNPTHTDATLYKIPITYTTKDGSGFDDTSAKSILSTASATLDLQSQDKWTIFNVQQVGYYRVNYDEKSWDLIRTGLLADNYDGIHILNRAQIVDDTLNLARGGILSYEIAFDILDYLDNEKNYIPWLAAYNGLSYIGRRFANHESEAFPKYVLKKFQNIYNHLGFYEREADTHIDILNRANVLQWLCKYGHEECIEKARDEFEKAKSDSTYLVPVAIRQVVFCTGVKHGSDSDWDWLWQKFVNEQMATEQIIVLNALGCTNDEQTVYKFLDRIFEDDSDIRSQDQSTAFSSLYNGHDNNIDRIWNYLANTDNRDQITKSVGFGGLASYISGISTRFVSRAQVTRLEVFLETHNEAFGGSANTLRSAIQNAEKELSWDSENLSIILPILVDKSKDGATTPVFSLFLVLFGLIVSYKRS